MRILAVGGGSGGHVTPIVAVLRELEKSQPDNLEVRFWCDRKFAPHARSIMAHYDKSLHVTTIFSGKFRRYHNLSVMRQLTRPSILLPNLRDLLLVGLGFLQSFFKLIVWRPDVVFTKGGFVCLPVGIAAALLKIPLVIHDSDAHPGLTNRILAKWATKIATGAPLEHYSYPKNKAQYVGIPIAESFRPISAALRQQNKQKLGLDSDVPLVVVTGGGLGAQRINDAVVSCLDDLLLIASVVLVSGSKQYDELTALTPNDKSSRFQLHAFVSKDMHLMLGAADIVVARAGATTILELAALAMPTILVPNGYLTGGHQLKNTAVYAKKDAVEVIDEHALDANPAILTQTVQALLENPKKMKQLSNNFRTFARPHAAADMAAIIIATAKHD